MQTMHELGRQAPILAQNPVVTSLDAQAASPLPVSSSLSVVVAWE